MTVLRRSPRLRVAALLLALFATLGATCGGDLLPPPGDELAVGTWGAVNAGAIVTEDGVHVHIGCTLGDLEGRIPLDDDNHFDVAGSYLLRAFPVAVGPTMPAQFVGTLRGGTLTLIVAVNDTVEKKLHVLGPVTLQYRRPAEMGPCPICRAGAMRAR